MRKISEVSIIGMGSLGILFGNFFINKMGREAVTYIANKERIKKYKENGIYCNGSKCDFKFKDVNSQTKPAELLIFAVKATALNKAIRDSKKLVGANTIIISLLNGITSERIIGNAFGNDHVLHCVAQGMDAVKIENKFTYSNMGELCIGILGNETKQLPKLQKVINLFDEIELPYTLEEDINHRLWSKWMLNVGVNQVVMINKGTYKTVQEDGEAKETMKAAMREVIKLAECEKINLTEEDLNGYVELVDSLNPEGMPSMRQDGIAKRYSEVEYFSGAVIKEAEKYGIDVPVNRMLYNEIKKLEEKYEPLL
ncbi:MAG: 2-dehydropantoate 2-reductase [Peptostreptococcaceae bacterium]|nr:2-dehydropantoate 2-reductase [Peptostreptococcaceae bacterium]